jgi:hypothetical protein
MVGGNFKMGKTRQPKNYSNENIKEKILIYKYKS